MRRLVLVGSLFVALSVWLAASIPVFGEDNGTVPVSVTVEAEACLLLQTTTINYGTQPFGGSSDRSVTFDSCTSAVQEVFANGTDGTGGANWTIVGTGICGNGLGTNQFKHAVQPIAGGNLFLSTGPASLGILNGNATNVTLPTSFIMPCPGSSGAGQTVNTSIELTAVLQ